MRTKLTCTGNPTDVSLSLCIPPLAAYIKSLDLPNETFTFQCVENGPIDNEWCTPTIHCQKGNTYSLHRVTEIVHDIVLVRYPHTFIQPDQTIRTLMYSKLKPILQSSTSLLIGGECYGYAFYCPHPITIVTDFKSIAEDARLNHPDAIVHCLEYSQMILTEDYEVCIVHTTKGLPECVWKQLHCKHLFIIACHEVEYQFQWISLCLTKKEKYGYVNVYEFIH